MNEFSHIEVRVIRNPDWLKEREKRGFFLSESFPVGEFNLPKDFEDMTEKEIELLRASLRTLIVLDHKPDHLDRLVRSIHNDNKIKGDSHE